MLCGHLNGRQSQEEGIYLYMLLIHSAVQQTLIQHCKATILQFKKKHIYSLPNNSNSIICDQNHNSFVTDLPASNLPLLPVEVHFPESLKSDLSKSKHAQLPPMASIFILNTLGDFIIFFNLTVQHAPHSTMLQSQGSSFKPSNPLTLILIHSILLLLSL